MKKIASLILSVLILGCSVVDAASPACFESGYSVFLVNGVFTDDARAKLNKDALESRLPKFYDNEPLTVDYLLNPSHTEGVLDITEVAIQKFFGPTATYDLTEILNDASDKLTTQKVLLVAHSEGNFYANNFYDKVVDKEGGISSQSLGVYGVATPADHVAGAGRYVTSDTDNVINAVRGLFPNTLPSNISISLDAGDTAFDRGHGFSKVYLPGAGDKILADIQYSLSALKSDPNQKEDARCLDPQKITLTHRVTGALLTTTDILASGVITTTKLAYQGVVFSVHLAYSFINLAWNTILETGRDLASLFYDAFSSQNSPIETIAGNGATVTLAFAAPPQVSVVEKNQTPQKSTIMPDSSKTQSVRVPVSKIVFTGVDKTKKSAETMKLVFTGFPGAGTGFVGSGGPPVSPPPVSQVLSYESGSVVVNTATTTTTIEETIATTTATSTATTTEEVATTTVTSLEAPIITALQCEQSLAQDGCLLATTSLQFSWNTVPDALYYEIDQNGITSTTTDTTLEVTAKDFSDYILSVKAVGDELSSETSSKTISVASIPVAINEIAWMGTQESASDEWLELKNNTTHVLDLTGWVLVAADGTPAIHFDKTIQSKEYIILERTDDNTISDIAAHTIYTGALGNSGEHLSLTYASTTYDSTPIGIWAGGENTSSSKRRTMERYSSKESGSDPLNWATNLGFIENGFDAEGNAIQGTPGERNSVSHLINKGKDIVSDLTITEEEGLYVIPAIQTVGASSTLTIDPGVTVSFYKDPENEDYESREKLIIEGSLHAEGTQEKPVTINSLTDEHAGTIEFRGEGMNILKYVATDNLLDGVVLESGALTIASSTIKNSDSSGVSNSGGTLAVTDSVISGGSSSGVGLYLDSGTSTIENTIVKDFSYVGIDAFSPPETTLISNTEVSNNNIGVLLPMETDEYVDLGGVNFHDNTQDVVVLAPI